MNWKTVFWIYSIGFALAVIFSSFEIDWKVVDWLGHLSVVVGLFFLHALAYKKQFFSQWVRKIIITIALLYWLVYVAYLDPKYGAYPGEGLADIIFNLVVVLPVFIPAAIYSFSKNTR